MRPREGVRVLDLTRLLPGPFATLVLADLGAQVDKIEDPDAGDYLRHMPPEETFLALNRNKRSACMDLKKPEAQAALLEMLPHYDVLIEQFRPKVMDRLGIGHDVLRAKNPRLIVCALTGYGQTGPLAMRAGHDIDYLARAGIFGFQGPASGPPQLPGFQLADVSGGLWCVIGILAALAERAKTGQGKLLDVSMTEAAMPFGIVSLASIFAGQHPKRGDDPITGGLAAYNVYATKDAKHMALGALEPKFWLTFATAVGLPADGMGVAPGDHQPALKAQVASIFASRTRAEWESFAQDHDCCLEPVLDPSELRTDPHHTARGMFFGKNLKLPLCEAAERLPPPKQGEHTTAILTEAGLSPTTIAALQNSTTIR